MARIVKGSLHCASSLKLKSKIIVAGSPAHRLGATHNVVQFLLSIGCGEVASFFRHSSFFILVAWLELVIVLSEHFVKSKTFFLLFAFPLRVLSLCHL